ncbi:MAG: CHASE2 domain-containing protein, partial [Selenomonadaceae bacterium]|nr:CHASE2 domain-containing protein [Selenomonadaceae bacterium]
MRAIINFFNFNRYPQEQRNQFKFNIFLGVVVLIFSVMVRNTAIVQGSINGWFDYYIMFRADSATDTQSAAQNITFLDFDNNSFQALGKPEMTPRDKVAELLEMAYTGNARIVIFDLDFSEADYSPAKMFAGDEVAKTGLERDKILFETISRIKNDPNSQTKILLPLVTYADKTIKPNVFASLIDNKKVFAVTPALTTNQVGDNYARFWLPYLEVKDENGERKILWSIPLLSSVLYGGNFSELENLQSEILNPDKDFFETTINHETTAEQFKFYREQTKNGGLIRDTASLQYNRIQYVALPPDVFAPVPLGTINPANIG